MPLALQHMLLSATTADNELSCRPLIAKFHYTDPTRTRPDPHGPARTFFAAKLRWVRAGPVGSV